MMMSLKMKISRLKKNLRARVTLTNKSEVRRRVRARIKRKRLKKIKFSLK